MKSELPSVASCRTLADLYVEARAGRLAECAACSRRPGANEKIPLDEVVFALGCGFHQRMAPGTVELVFVVRDPSFSRERSWVGCEDGHVCPWCHDDPSAKRFRHFYGKAFGSFLKPDAVGRYPVFFTNAVLHGRGRNTAPTAGERRACRPVLERQIELVRPRAVVALGHHACQSVAGIYGLSSQALLSATQPLQTRAGPWLWGTYHPSPLAASKSDEIAAKFAVIATWLERFERL